MRFNILGFDQVKAFEYGLTLDELMILRHMHDFVSSGRMETTIHENEIYYWIKYDKFISDLPILNMKKTRLMEIFNNNLSEKPIDWKNRYNSMSEATKKRANSFKFTGMIKGYTKKDKTGTYSYFAFTKKFYDMIPAITGDDEANKKADTGKVSTGQKTNNFNNNKSISDENTKSKEVNTYKKFKPNYKNKFHNCNSSLGNYTNEQIEEMANDRLQKSLEKAGGEK